MTDRPILFSAPMVRAILNGRKTQTRRVLKPQPDYRGSGGFEHDAEEWGWDDENGDHISVLDIVPNGYRIGDRLWVRETWQEFFEDEIPAGRSTQISGRMGIPAQPRRRSVVVLRADGEMPNHPEHGRALWRPSIYMPRWASRLTLLVTDVRVQRLQDISEADAIAEGIEQVGRHNGEPLWKNYSKGPTAAFVCPIKTYRLLWNSIHGPGAWDANPWVAAISFDVVRANIDEVEK